MRSHSTPQSALNLEITKLAIAECVVSIGLYVGAGVYLGTFRYLAIAVIVAPLMLFRTPASADWGLKVYTKFLRVSSRWPLGCLFRIFLFSIGMPLVGNAIRIVATVYWAMRSPLQTLAETPQNWLRQSLCTDLIHPPEIIPLEAVKDTDPDYYIKFEFLYKAVRELDRSAADDPDLSECARKVMRFCSWPYTILVFLPFIIIGWLPSVIYRISFKATALAYAPFIWVAHATLRNPLPLKASLERITKGELEKVRRGFSWIILTTLFAKVGLLFTWIDRSYIESKFPSQRFVASFVILDHWPWWQITLGTDALLTFFLLYFADAALARLEGQAWREEVVLKTVSTVSFLRAAIGIVTVSHFFFVAFMAAAPNTVLRLLTFG